MLQSPIFAKILDFQCIYTISMQNNGLHICGNVCRDSFKTGIHTVHPGIFNQIAPVVPK